MTDHARQILIYGANGYTGQLVLQRAVDEGLKPIVSGRDIEAVEMLANRYQLTARPFRLASVDTVANSLQDVDIVINCAGPFSATAEIMMRGCIQAHADYLDITGEICVFELARSFDTSAKASGVVLCPGVGFDVIPTDCMAAQLKQMMPDATSLALSFDSTSTLSPGTAQTSVEGIKMGGRIRENGKLRKVWLGYHDRSIDFGNGPRNATTIPWGDVFTAGETTAIPNIRVYLPMSPARSRQLKIMNLFRWFLAQPWMQQYLKKKAREKYKGPSPSDLQNSKTMVWGEVSNGQHKIEGLFETANGYLLTALGAVAVARHLNEFEGKGGYYTPSQLCGADLVQRLDSTTETQFVQGTVGDPSLSIKSAG